MNVGMDVGVIGGVEELYAVGLDTYGIGYVISVIPFQVRNER